MVMPQQIPISQLSPDPSQPLWLKQYRQSAGCHRPPVPLHVLLGIHLSSHFMSLLLCNKNGKTLKDNLNVFQQTVLVEFSNLHCVEKITVRAHSDGLEAINVKQFYLMIMQLWEYYNLSLIINDWWFAK